MKHLKKVSKRNIVLISVGLLIVVAAITATLLYLNTPKSIETANEQKLTFVFDVAKSPGWWSPGSYPVTDEDLKNSQQGNSEPMPLASIAAFKGVKGDSGNQCFIMAFYKDGNIDIPTTIKEKTVPQTDSGSFVSVGTTQQTMQTSEGTKTYTVYQYNLINQPNSQLGNEFGYVQLKNGYIEVQGVCPTADMLGDTVIAIDALSLKI